MKMPGFGTRLVEHPKSGKRTEGSTFVTSPQEKKEREIKRGRKAKRAGCNED